MMTSPASTLIEIELDATNQLNPFEKEVHLKNFFSFTLHPNSPSKPYHYLSNSPHKKVPVFLAQTARRASEVWQGWETSSLKFVLLCIAWYASSSITNNIGKLILIESNYPLTLTYFQFGIIAFFCTVLRCLFYRTEYSLGSPPIKQSPYGSLLTTLSHFTKPSSYGFIIPSRKDFNTCLPLALFQISTHICNSYATAAIPVSFVHTIKALSPLFTVLCYRFLYQVKYPIKIYGALFPLTVGVMMFCYDSLAFSLVGIGCSLLSCLIYALQSIITKKYLFKTPTQPVPTHQSQVRKIDILLYSSLIAFVLMFPLWWAGEGRQFLATDPTLPLTSATAESDRWYRLVWYYLLNGGSQCIQALLSFTLLTHTDVVTFSVASQLKRVVVITTALLYFGQTVTPLRAGGLLFTIFGLYVYDRTKRTA